MFNWLKSWPSRPHSGNPSKTSNGKVVTLNFDIEDFDSVLVHSALDVEIAQGEYSIQATIPEECIVNLVVEKRRGQLYLSLKGNVQCQQTMTVRVVMPMLHRLEAFDATHVQAAITSHHSLQVTTHGASTVVLYGEGVMTQFMAHDASTLDASGFSSQLSTCEARGAATLKTHATQSIDAKAQDASSIVVKGSPPAKTLKKGVAAPIKER